MHHAKLKPALEIIVPDSCRHLSNKLKKCIRRFFLPLCFLFFSNHSSLLFHTKLPMVQEIPVRKAPRKEMNIPRILYSG